MSKWLLSFGMLNFVACNADGDKESDSDENSVFGQNEDDTDNVDGSGCPDIVPEEYRFNWDCENAEECSAKLYRYGVGESFADGSFQVTEQWFKFEGPGAYCVDTFYITGEWDSREPATFGGGTAEELFEITWEMADSQCEVIWSPMFADQEADDPVTQTYGGFMMFDTHNPWNLRNEEYRMLLIAAPVNGSQYTPNSNYAQGTVTPTDPDHALAMSEDAAGDWCCEDPLAGTFQPSEYVWTNSGDCLQ